MNDDPVVRFYQISLLREMLLVVLKSIHKIFMDTTQQLFFAHRFG